MRVACLLSISAVLLLGAAPAARAGNPMPSVRANQWDDAKAAVAGEADPVMDKLVTFYRLLAPNAARAGEIAAFIEDSPDWPFQPTLAKRRDEALDAEPDDSAAAAVCPAVAAAPALLRCAEAFAGLGRSAEANDFARRAWIALPNDASLEKRLTARFAASLDSHTEWQRFDRLAWTDSAAATRQLPRLAASDRARAEARLALRHDDSRALALLAAVPPDQRSDPGLVLEHARSLRRAERFAEALAVWTADGTAAERAAPDDRRGLFWDERNQLARRLLRDGNAAGACAVASGHAQQDSERVADAEFLAGFIALRKLNDATAAAQHFRALAAASRATITQARAAYWLGRASSGDAARDAFKTAASYPSTFYGQLASLALGEGPAGLAARIRATRDPSWDAAQALDFAGRELARAAVYLAGWGEPRRAQSFLLRLEDIVPDPADRAMTARLAIGFEMPETAIALARRAGRDGSVLLGTGWPEPVVVPLPSPVEPALALGIMRQESSFDATTTSPVGAKGLMQLMPGTAAQVARVIGMHTPLPSLTADTRANMELGTAYLRQMLDRFDGSMPLAIAAYNAGPGRVGEWLATYGDPRASGGDMIDWIEQIPFNETRNYVQRVIENLEVYRARRGTALAHPLAAWLH